MRDRKLTKLARSILGSIPNDWDASTIGALAGLGSGGTPSRSMQDRYFTNGTTPWVKTGDLNNAIVRDTKEHITEFALSETNCSIYPAKTLLIAMYGGFKQIGRTGLLANPAATNQALTAIQVRNGSVDPEFLQNWLNAKVNAWRPLAGSSRKDPNITKSEIELFPVPLPPKPEQVAISRVLRALTDEMDCIGTLYKARRKLKRGLVQQLLTGHRRFPEFRNQPWRKCRLRDVAEECNEPGRGTLGRDRIMGVSKSRGIVPMEDRLIGSVDRYQIVRNDWFAYNPMRLNIGSIARSRSKSPVLVSPDYVVFHCKHGELDPAFLDQYRKGHLWESFMRVCGAGSVRVRIYFNDLGRHKMHLPPIEEQRHIAGALGTFDEGLSLLRQLHDALKEQKRGLMQKLLTGKVRVPASMLDEAARS